MGKKRRTYTPEFKAEAVKLITEQDYSVAAAARSLGLNDNRSRSWEKKLLVTDFGVEDEIAWKFSGYSCRPLRRGKPLGKGFMAETLKIRPLRSSVR